VVSCFGTVAYSGWVVSRAEVTGTFWAELSLGIVAATPILKEALVAPASRVAEAMHGILILRHALSASSY
jgi:hypothetical protein